MITCSRDGLLKKWDISTLQPIKVRQKDLKIGAIHGLDVNPDDPSLVAIAGTKKSQNLTVVDLSIS